MSGAEFPKSEIRSPQSEIPIVFMATATFALPSLDRLFENGYRISGVITQPDMPSGRGQAVQAPPVKKRAFDLHLPIYQPKSLKTDEAHALVDALAPEMIVVVAYGKILPPWLLHLPRYGCINLHGSLLPKYRGAAPVHWAIANGETTTGVCTMQLNEGLDTGPVYLCEETPIGAEETAPQLYDRLAHIGGELMMETVNGILKESLQAKPQDDSKATLAPILKKEHGFIDWSMPPAAIHNRVRAFYPWPGTVAKFRGTVCKILKTAVRQSVDHGQPSADPGTGQTGQTGLTGAGTIVASKGSLGVICGGGSVLEILTIQPENRKPISGPDFANGARIQPGEKFESCLKP